MCTEHNSASALSLLLLPIVSPICKRISVALLSWKALDLEKTHPIHEICFHY